VEGDEVVDGVVLIKSKNSTGYQGVIQTKYGFTVQLNHEYLGHFQTAKEASFVYSKAKGKDKEAKAEAKAEAVEARAKAMAEAKAKAKAAKTKAKLADLELQLKGMALLEEMEAHEGEGEGEAGPADIPDLIDFNTP
jgi:hypothetical protein